MSERIPFNKPYFTGAETAYIEEAVANGKISGDGAFTARCQTWFEERYGFGKCLLTTSCTDALEMCALLLNLEPGDEVIMPSYTFVSTANAFVLRGAQIVFADSQKEQPNLNHEGLEALITSRTKAIVVVHYAGMACDMEAIKGLCDEHNLCLIEDAAQAVDSFYGNQALGSIGHLATFSFHETKNIMSGEGGMLVINDPQYTKRAEIIREKGTNRSAFFRGEVDKYNWVDVGSSFLPSDIIAAILFAQLEQLDDIQKQRKEHWERYYEALSPLSKKLGFTLPTLPKKATNNAHMFYIVGPDVQWRDRAIRALRSVNMHSVFHYISLHRSPFFSPKHDGRELPNSDHFTDGLLRLPLYYELPESAAATAAKALTSEFS
ncbi:dTDP-4-amino-4,6-dideoxygalactose transaminase [Cryomorphaceae bacterium]|nr:dTDP-4-amino-4,6-dideoxygalactose transaminase [Cryomorphaceae bacterium]